MVRHTLKILYQMQCCLSITTENISKPKGFLMFSGGKDKQHRTVMG